jgi:fatty-acyl-CoA synthase
MTALTADRDREVLRWRGTGLTAGEALRSVTGLVAGLQDLDVGPGDVVAILVAPNSPTMLIARYAAHLVGAAVCHLRSTNPASTAVTLSPEAQAGILHTTSARVLVTDQENEARARSLGGLVPADLSLTGFDLLGAGTHRVDPAEVPPRRALPPEDPEALAVIGFTTGSTGRPKGILLRAGVWENLVCGLLPLLPPRMRLLCTTPLENTVGPMVDATLLSAGTALLHPEFDPGAVLHAIETDRVTEMFLATTFLYRLVDHPGLPATDLSSLRGVIYGGSSASPRRLEDAVRVFGPILVQGYGTSECGTISVLQPDEHLVPGLLRTVGRALPGVGLRICATGSERELPPGEEGEVCVRTRNAMAGYLADPDLTARVLRDGWYRTGDLGCVDDQGYLHLRERIDDIVKTAGVKVYPCVVERQLLRVPGVRDAVVFGTRDEDRTEHLHAALVPRPEVPISLDDVRTWIGKRLAEAHVPEDFLLLDELPLTVAGKPDRARLRELMQHRLTTARPVLRSTER